MTKTFILVHGAWQAPYAWQSVAKQLEAKGNKVVIIELPAHGTDNTPPIEISMDSYNQRVIGAINGLSGQVILVGHSMGGLVISGVAEKIPSKIEKLVFIAAYVPSNGQSLMDLSMMDKKSLLPASLMPSEDQLTLDIKRENLINIFCQDAGDKEQELVLANYRPEPAIPFTNKVLISTQNFGKVDKYYIRTTKDHAVGIALQDEMINTTGISQIYSVTTGHCPFISRPQEITDILLTLIQTPVTNY